MSGVETTMTGEIRMNWGPEVTLDDLRAFLAEAERSGAPGDARLSAHVERGFPGSRDPREPEYPSLRALSMRFEVRRGR